MKISGKTVGGAMLTLALVLGITATSSVTAEAQYRNDDRYERRQRDGRDRRDRNKRWRHRRDRDDDRDWNRRNGNWRRRDGRYDNNGVRNRGRGNGRGYGNRDIYNNRGIYSNRGVYNNNQVELDRGYRQGLSTGSSDAQRGQSYNPERSRYYRNPSSQAFREGFVRGYDQGYRQYAGYGNQRSRSGGIGGIFGGILGRP